MSIIDTLRKWGVIRFGAITWKGKTKDLPDEAFIPYIIPDSFVKKDKKEHKSKKVDSDNKNMDVCSDTPGSDE